MKQINTSVITFSSHAYIFLSFMFLWLLPSIASGCWKYYTVFTGRLLTPSTQSSSQ